MTSDTEFSTFCPGVLEVLSIGKGDLRLTIGDSDEDREKARVLIEEMLRKGYSIFIDTELGPERVAAFNPRRMTYVIADVPVTVAEQDEKPAPRERGKQREVPVSGSRSTAVGRTAGG